MVNCFRSLSTAKPNQQYPLLRCIFSSVLRRQPLLHPIHRKVQDQRHRQIVHVSRRRAFDDGRNTSIGEDDPKRQEGDPEAVQEKVARRASSEKDAADRAFHGLCLRQGHLIDVATVERTGNRCDRVPNPQGRRDNGGFVRHESVQAKKDEDSGKLDRAKEQFRGRGRSGECLHFGIFWIIQNRSLGKETNAKSESIFECGGTIACVKNTTCRSTIHTADMQRARARVCLVVHRTL